MNKPDLTLWSVPMDVVPAVLETLRRECCASIHMQDYKKADSILYCIKSAQRDYDEALAEYETDRTRGRR